MNKITQDLILDGSMTCPTVHNYSICASELEWPPGHFPLTIETTLGNKLPFYKVFQENDYALYRQTSGSIELRVYND